MRHFQFRIGTPSHRMAQASVTNAEKWFDPTACLGHTPFSQPEVKNAHAFLLRPRVPSHDQRLTLTPRMEN